ncbi:MAG TPA: hypothetical protein VK609_03945 [Mucilaginibacter sp.]|nr:hypothetical protein [Mucilaginibacter sp.]
MKPLGIQQRRVIVVFWKNDINKPFEVFSNLKNFCLSYAQFNYNTMSNYLSKAKVAYENHEIRLERLGIISNPKPVFSEMRIRKIAPVVRKVMMKNANDEQYDLEYWQGKSVKERAAAVTFIISQSLKKEQRMDKTKLVKTKHL